MDQSLQSHQRGGSEHRITQSSRGSNSSTTATACCADGAHDMAGPGPYKRTKTAGILRTALTIIVRRSEEENVRRKP